VLLHSYYGFHKSTDNAAVRSCPAPVSSMVAATFTLYPVMLSVSCPLPSSDDAHNHMHAYY
jgi:hypothetical protein